MNDTEELLSQLRDIQIPAVSLVPAPGWWIVSLLCLLLAWLAYLFYQRQLSRGWQREAAAELAQLRSDIGSVPVAQSLAAASRLTRRVVLAVRPRRQVAALQGEAWLNTLDELCGKPLFTEGFGNLLEQGPYQPHHSLSDEDLNAVMDVVAELIEAAGRLPTARGVA